VPHRVPAVLSRESCALRAQIVALCASPTWRRGQAWGTVKTLLASEDSLFKARATARRSQISLLQSKISQLGEEISGLDAPVAVQDQATRADHWRTIGCSGTLRQTVGTAGAVNRRLTPQLTGAVSYVSDISHDHQSYAPYFTVRVALSEEERRRLAGPQLVPGMLRRSSCRRAS
jgi:hypothetical protein